MPPRHRGGRRRDTRHVSVTVGQYHVTGDANLRDDANLDADLVARHPFLPLTSAAVSRQGETGDETFDVVIVSLAASTRFEPA